MEKRKVIVIGGGPAGLMAAGQASLAGADVVILEKMARPGRKLNITGKGRCNITNTAEIADFITHFGKSGRFLRQAFSQFFAPELMAFFEGIGLALVIERGGRVFPASGSAPDVTAALLKWVKSAGVSIKKKAQVTALSIKDGQVVGVMVGGQLIDSDAVILATGGASYPDTGSTGDGYQLARDAGHKIVTLRPALVPLETAGQVANRMAGLSLLNINVRVYIDGKKKKEAFGEMAFTEFGVSGPVILTLSGFLVDSLEAGKEITLSIDLKPALDDKKLDARLLREFTSRAKEPMDSIMRSLLPRLMVPISLEECAIDPVKRGSTISSKERKRLRSWLKDFELKVTCARPLDEAIVTAGGVNTREVDPRTMQSRLTRGLYIVGELLDVQADTGGYNLQAAFSTGYVAGRSAAETTKE